jgi:hypothetical protein
VGTKRVLYVDSAGSATVDTFGVQRSGLVDRGLTSTDGGTVDATVSGNGRFLYVQTGATGRVDEYAIGSDGSPSAIGSVLVPGAVGGEGIASA